MKPVRLTKEQAVLLIKQLQQPDYVPSITMTADLCGVPRHLVYEAYRLGSQGVGSDLENAFAMAVNKIRGQYKQNALAVITMPDITRAGEPRARQYQNVLSMLEREGEKIMAAAPVAPNALPAPAQPGTPGHPSPDDLVETLKNLERGE